MLGCKSLAPGFIRFGIRSEPKWDPPRRFIFLGLDITRRQESGLPEPNLTGLLCNREYGEPNLSNPDILQPVSPLCKKYTDGAIETHHEARDVLPRGFAERIPQILRGGIALSSIVKDCADTTVRSTTYHTDGLSGSSIPRGGTSQRRDAR